jgi:hypothetical protein
MDYSAPIGPGGAALQSPDLNYAGGLNVTVSGSSAQSAAIQARAVLISPDTNIWLTMGANPTATVGAGSVFIPAGALVTLNIQPGQKIAVIQATAGGNCSIIPCAYPN